MDENSFPFSDGTLDVVSFFLHDEYKYSHLLRACLKYNPSFAKKIDECRDINFRRKIEETDLFVYKTDLDELFLVLTDSVNLESEIVNKKYEIAESQKRKEEIDMISLEDLKLAFDSMQDPNEAKQLYFQLDFNLRRNNAWNNHKIEIADSIDARLKENEKNVNITAKKVEMHDTTINKNMAPFTVTDVK